MQIETTGGPATLYVMHEFGSHNKNFRLFKKLNVSGSSQFTEPDLISMTNHWGKNITIFNLRQESCLFLNGHAAAVRDDKNQANNGLNIKQIESAERKIQRLLFSTGIVNAWFWENDCEVSIEVQKIFFEKELVKSYGLQYVRYSIPDQTHPSPEIVDDFVERVCNRPKHHRFHIHCEAGWGRTTTFLFMVEAMKNATRKTFKDLLQRQVDKGGCDLSEKTAHEQWKIACRKARYRFVKTFYKYCRKHPDFDIKFSEFNRSRQKKVV